MYAFACLTPVLRLSYACLVLLVYYFVHYVPRMERASKRQCKDPHDIGSDDETLSLSLSSDEENEIVIPATQDSQDQSHLDVPEPTDEIISEACELIFRKKCDFAGMRLAYSSVVPSKKVFDDFFGGKPESEKQWEQVQEYNRRVHRHGRANVPRWKDVIQCRVKILDTEYVQSMYVKGLYKKHKFKYELFPTDEYDIPFAVYQPSHLDYHYE